MKKVKTLTMALAITLALSTVSMPAFAEESVAVTVETESEVLFETETLETEVATEESETQAETAKETEEIDTVLETEEQIEESETQAETAEQIEEVETELKDEENEEIALKAALGKVTNLKAVSAGKCAVKLTWNSVAGAEGYLIYAQKEGQYGYVGMTTLGTTFTDKQALDNDYNFYWVFPYVTNASGKMVPGGCEKYVYAKGVCQAVSNLKASSVANAVKLTWSAVSGADGYLIYGIYPGIGYSYIGMTTRGTTFTDVKASTEDYNFYWVFPYHLNSSGKMIVGGTAPYVYGKAKWVLNTPNITKISRDRYDSLTVYWSEVPYAEKYDVYRSKSKTSGYKQIATIDSETSLEDTGLEQNTYYYYKIVAICYRDGKRVTSGFSAVSTERTAKEPQFSACVTNTQGKYSHFGNMYVNNLGDETLTIGGSAIVNFAHVYPYEGANYTKGTLVDPMTLNTLTAYNFPAGTSGVVSFKLEQQRYFSNGAHIAFIITYDGIEYIVAVDDTGEGYYL